MELMFLMACAMPNEILARMLKESAEKFLSDPNEQNWDKMEFHCMLVGIKAAKADCKKDMTGFLKEMEESKRMFDHFKEIKKES